MKKFKNFLNVLLDIWGSSAAEIIMLIALIIFPVVFVALLVLYRIGFDTLFGIPLEVEHVAVTSYILLLLVGGIIYYLIKKRRRR